jgi:hypothetical protein
MLLGFEQIKLSGFEPNPDLKWERIGDVPAPDDRIEDDICRVDGFCLLLPLLSTNIASYSLKIYSKMRLMKAMLDCSTRAPEN